MKSLIKAYEGTLALKKNTILPDRVLLSEYYSVPKYKAIKIAKAYIKRINNENDCSYSADSLSGVKGIGAHRERDRWKIRFYPEYLVIGCKHFSVEEVKEFLEKV